VAAQAVVRPKEELEFLAAYPAVALPAGVGAIRTVACAEAPVACDKLGDARLAVAAGMRPAAQALPEICGRVVRPTLPVRAELASSFEAEVLTIASFHLCLSCGPLSPAAGTTQQRREAKETADFRDEQRALVTSSSSRYIVEAVEQAILSLSC